MHLICPMNKNLLKFFTLSLLFVSNFAMFAQGDDDDGGCLECPDPAPAPINSKIIILLIAGIIFAFYTFRRNKKVV